MSGHFYKWGFWMRLGKTGRGVSIAINAPMLFSERNGSRKVLRIGPMKIEALRSYQMGCEG